MAFCDPGEIAFCIHLAKTAANTSVFAECVLDVETDHTVAVLFILYRAEEIAEKLEAFRTVIVISVDYAEWLVDCVLAHQHGVVCSPWFCSFGIQGEAFRKLVGRLEDNLDRHVTLIF